MSKVGGLSWCFCASLLCWLGGHFYVSVSKVGGLSWCFWVSLLCWLGGHFGVCVLVGGVVFLVNLESFCCWSVRVEHLPLEPPAVGVVC